MNERCIDASVIVKLVLKGEPHRVTARRLIRESTAAMRRLPNCVAANFGRRTKYFTT